MEKTYQRIIINRFYKAINSALLLVALLFPTVAQGQQIRLIADEETEQLLAKITKPLFEAAKVKFDRNEIHIVNDPSLNAFVADGNHLFIHTGTILNAGSPNELAGVIAHETGHIQGGHILRQKLKNQSMQEVGLVSAILAGTAAVVTGRGDVAMAAMLGTQSSALTHYTRYRTEEERSADEAAISLLEKTQQSPQGMLSFMKKISQQNQMSGREETPYFRTHPVTVERISFFEQAVQTSALKQSSPYQDEFDRVKAKLYAYLLAPEQTLAHYPLSNSSTPALYAQSIALFKQLKFEAALKKIDTLIAREPQNPFFYELKGQIYLETGKIFQAKENYKKALSLLPNSALLQTSYAQSILEDSPTSAQAEEAIRLLNKSIISHPNGFGWMLLARAYGEVGNEAAANYAAAEYSWHLNQPEVAKSQLEVAKKAKPSSQLALKIDDLANRLDEVLKKKRHD